VLVTWLGTAAAVASTVSFTPQAWKIIQTAETKDISAGMYVITVTAFALRAIYGGILRQWPLVASNVICFGLSGFYCQASSCQLGPIPHGRVTKNLTIRSRHHVHR
jgi:MtN3 and saliva related transmembrane protein